MNPDEVHAKLEAINESLTIMGKELMWILEEGERTGAKPGTPLGTELGQRFFTLYRDFKKLKLKAVEFMKEIAASDSASDDKKVYMISAVLTAARFENGIFRQFTYVAETGNLPPEHQNPEDSI